MPSGKDTTRCHQEELTMEDHDFAAGGAAAGGCVGALTSWVDALTSWVGALGGALGGRLERMATPSM